MRKLFILLLSSMLFTPSVLQAKLEDYAKHEGWYIYKDDHDCTMAAAYEEPNGELSFDYNSREGSVTVRFSIPQAKSVVSETKYTLSTYFLNKTTNYMDDGWDNREFTVIRLNDTVWATRVFDSEFLVDLAKYDNLSFFYNDTLLGSYNLSDSAKAVSLLKQCATERGRANPSDPFV